MSLFKEWSIYLRLASSPFHFHLKLFSFSFLKLNCLYCQYCKFTSILFIFLLRFKRNMIMICKTVCMYWPKRRLTKKNIFIIGMSLSKEKAKDFLVNSCSLGHWPIILGCLIFKFLSSAGQASVFLGTVVQESWFSAPGAYFTIARMHP